MKPALFCFSVLMSLSMWFGAQGTAPIICRGKPLPITVFAWSENEESLSAASLWRDQAHAVALG
jgi:hypothetical protein